ncbi:PREDICTED: galactose-3-O-sulfotransferase 2-like [Branchiostoma belcheri]|uniref:Galactose-3-O-sulfotransferase 2-like n=1 Tax=Branchiostoma belcheri TaxID=7741 RepID=A0A6P4Z1P8_BRABE|nr:PREDICTED: galactose-3-O-sulfotransferase 2-like [Branchiostoma belcheri]
MTSRAAVLSTTVLLATGVVTMVMFDGHGDQDSLQERDDVIDMEDCGLGYNVSSTTGDPPDPCTQPVTRFMFVKTHRAGSTTVAAILYRFGLTHDLNAVLPSTGDLLGWPFEIRPGNYFPLKPGLEHDVIVDRAVYRPDMFQYFFPNDMIYLGILRHPLDHLQACFSEYDLQKLYNLPTKQPIQTFLDDPYTWERKLHSQRMKRKPYSFTKNFQAYSFGYSLGLSEDLERTKRFVDRIVSEFKFVLILEYLDESLVALKREMCWETRDILYANKTCCKVHRPLQLTDRQSDNHRTFAAADYLLYERFVGILKDKIRQQGQDFQDELQDFKEVNKQVQDFCDSKDVVGKKLVLEEAKWHGKIVLDRTTCQLRAASLSELRKAAQRTMVAKGRILTSRRSV